jgi:peroxiredoxin
MARVRAQAAPTEDPGRLQEDVRRRNRRIVELAEEAIAKSHSRPEQKQHFLAAVHHLLEARVQLALQNDRESIAALYDDAAALYDRDAAGEAAALAGTKLVEFAGEMARRHGDRETRWLSEFARQARMFAANHASERLRAAEMLDAAAWSCEAHGLLDEALGCYQLLQAEFADTPHAAQAVAMVRRLELRGERPQIAGPTFDGGYLDLERDLADKVVLVVFWDSSTKACQETLALVAEAHARYASRGLEIVGISLDEDERALEAAFDRGVFPWPTIFHAHRKLRRWNSPVVKFYGVREIPLLWLVDRSGAVVSTQVDPERLDEVLAPLCQAP